MTYFNYHCTCRLRRLKGDYFPVPHKNPPRDHSHCLTSAPSSPSKAFSQSKGIQDLSWIWGGVSVWFYPPPPRFCTHPESEDHSSRLCAAPGSHSLCLPSCGQAPPGPRVKMVPPLGGSLLTWAGLWGAVFASRPVLICPSVPLQEKGRIYSSLHLLYF